MASERPKHIEVCVRLRPLVVQEEISSSSFFHSKRKPGLPSPSSPEVRRLRAAPPTPESSKSNVYAWGVVDTDTVNQSPLTDRVPGRTHQYTLDRVYGPNMNTETLYQNSVQDLVHAAMEGYHTAVLAYGQTSTGKTHTMTGTVSEPGLIPLAVRECFQWINSQLSQREYLLRISYLEVYKEHIKDLLNKTYQPIRLFEQQNHGLVIRGLKEEVVTTPEQVFQILAQGEARRQVGATHLNQHSSRSHVMVKLWIESRDTNDSNNVRVSSLSLVDLAGSESVRLTGSTDRQAEGHYINQSLMTLGKVVYALSESDKKQHVPYRDSKLTRLLQPSLSGNAQVVLVCCISPLPSHLEESHNTFKFAIRAKKIPQKAEIQESEEKTLLETYREEIEDLRQQLEDAQQQLERSKLNGAPRDSFFIENSESEMQELVEAIQTMEKLILKTKPAQKLSPLLTPPLQSNGTNNDLPNELGRIQTLLSTVLQKRHYTETKITELEARLEQQEVAGTLRQADASFLTIKLSEKDVLLQEVSQLLEAVEERQSALEAENKALKEQLRQYHQQQQES